MIEIITRRFRLEEDEKAPEILQFIMKLPGYRCGSYTRKHDEITAEFIQKVI